METRQEKTSAQRLRERRIITITLLALGSVATIVLNLTLGQFSMSLGEVWRQVLAGPGGSYDEHSAGPHNSVLWNIRVPRLILGLLVGSALAVAGTILQGLLGNPLAEPGVIGVTSGAGVGAAAAIVFGWTFLGTATVPFFAFLSGIITTLLVYRLSRSQGKVHILTLILTGIAVNAVAGALISFFVFLAPTSAREEIIFWQMGSLNGAQWKHIATVIIPIVGCVAGAIAIARWLDVLALGEKAARHAGVRVGVMRPLVVGLSTALAAAAVSFAGIIGFVGLIVPHILRQALGPSNRWLVPLSAVGGAVLVTLSDLVARTLIAYAELPIGIFTALVGGPTFFILLRRNLARYGGAH
ncbi:iron chelate uptake ABC transporter family permease subunit [Corynebacterium sp. zg254]|uniref:Iron ABC transporter permease n=1 Tax=Corynebacterium zhongnanshanii TaxID=2768834 RepID=A0ABQ6VF13_9CORY|nr:MULTISPECIES: iron ABC transporter permease [Corynebacterium]KAB3520871.1 iron ABC transporter permease [Corynebacterium zhongnanshanii]MCR5914498.1 iron chelate uptake ABC transporter family permease subunit [Corynebacterium sp. zg254]